MLNRSAAKTIDQYIAEFPKDVQQILEKVRATIRSAAPDAEEAISYAMPTFKLHGNLVHFAGYARHIGFYPIPSGVEHFKDKLAAYKTSKGAVQFPLDRPIPYDLIREITEFRVRENVERAKKKK